MGTFHDNAGASSGDHCTEQNSDVGRSDSKPEAVTETFESTSKHLHVSNDNKEHNQRDVQDRPPLPPRPSILLAAKEERKGDSLTPQRTVSGRRPQLSSTPTLALSRADIQTQLRPDGTRETFVAGQETHPSSGKSGRLYTSIKRYKGLGGSDAGDTASIRSFAPVSDAGADNESLIGDVLGTGEKTPLWKLFNEWSEPSGAFQDPFDEQRQESADFHHEFDKIFDEENMNNMLAQWTAKRKHFLILSSAGKPIYSRHGDDSLISSIMGTIQTIISFFEGQENHLRSFKTVDARFVVVSQGPLYLVGISKLAESDTQIRSQLEALYMQILSTLTLPTLRALFANRPSTDLRRPLKGTEVLLSSLADAFTRGSPSALLSALECLKLRRSERKSIEDAMLRNRCPDLLYGMIVAGGKLVSVIRPRKHSLHAGDLQLIFNMLFEADGIKDAGGENWIPLCLPAFNQNGYLYMYVSFVLQAGDRTPKYDNSSSPLIQEDIVVILLSSNKESFHELKRMRDALVSDMENMGILRVVKESLCTGRPLITDIVPGTVARHFLYKSKAHVQFVMPSYEPNYLDMLARRRLLSVYHQLQASVHAKNLHLHVKHCISRNHMSIAWITPAFELYCVASSQSSRAALIQSANRILQWLRREEQRVFIVGGGIF